MRCEKVMEMLSLYIDNELNEQEKNEIEKHLKACEECNREYEDLLTIKRLLSEAPILQLPKDFKEELHQKLVKCNTEDNLDNNDIIDLKDEKKKSKYKKKSNWKILYGIAAGILVTVISVSSLINLMNNDIETKEFAQMENKESRSEEAVPFNLAMEEANYKTDEEGASKQYSGANMKIARTNLKAKNRAADFQNEKVEEDIKAIPKKIISNGYIQLQVEDYDSTYNKLVNLITSKGGFVQNSNTSYKNSKTKKLEKPLKKGHLLLRVPKNELDNMFDEIKNMGSTTREDINTNDMTDEYKEIFGKRENLKLQEKKLREIMDNTKDFKEISNIEEELTQIIGEIEGLSQKLLTIDDLEALSTIDIYLDEIN
ncbi:DUF4349 domain-containing protein [Paramaledivibacter caminithermalis]|jgi:hypothetical protein|uniref:Anti-sigma-W factor RsiW n=1 Tax=Paramaledivibacter caminithermalis (strain DSM 15212 / CIP 107654 / DViRD3) TaxID=1121301 RepID=A0A1M6ME07_PARC5|nr:DUF4349 domain-containing protein [Paramaledivibacter caminithermalis]SHJ81679.1 Putative zinc-finger [Paramaledivibacter caminithermalis DSM 15212]